MGLATSGASSHLASILTWTLLPSFLSNLLLSTFYRFFPSHKPQLPPSATPQQIAHENRRAQDHARRARLLLIGGYLVWTIVGTYVEQGRGANANYYTLLGIERALVEEEGASAVKSRWRKLARVYHPDKVGKEGEAFFVALRRGVDVLENDGKRWAYERFGEGVVEWGKLVTNREFLVRGVQQSAAFYVFALGSIFTISFFRKDERAHNFWRYLALALTLSTELHLILLPSPSPLFTFLLPNRLPYEHIAFLRQLFISCSMAISQLAPLLFPPTAATSNAIDPTASPEEQAAARALADAEALRPLLQRLALLTAQADSECIALQQQELRPLMMVDAGLAAAEGKKGRREREEEVVRGLKEGMVRTFEDLQVKSNPRTAEVWAQAVKKGRASDGGGGGGSGKKATKSTCTSTTSSGASTPSSSTLLPTVPLASLRSPSPSPSFTAASNSLASPPSSPQLSFTLSTPAKPLRPEDVPLPPSPPASPVAVKAAKLNGQPNGAGRPDASRLQSPPPEN